MAYHILLTIGMDVRKVVALIVVTSCAFSALLCEVTSLMRTPYLLSSIFFTFLQICEKGAREKVSVFVYQSRNSQGILIHVFGMNSAI